jgi:hypothetical protein
VRVPGLLPGIAIRVFASAAIVMLVPIASVAQKPIPMRDLQLRGSLKDSTRHIEMVAKATIGTPLGRVPVNAYIHIDFDCTSGFVGTVTYSRLVRFFAKLKGIDLVVAMDGTVQSTDSSATESCMTLAAASFLGQALVDTTVMSGWVKLANDSIPFRGPAWMSGDTSYHTSLVAMRAGRQFDLRVNMYESPQQRPTNTTATAPVSALAPRGRKNE